MFQRALIWPFNRQQKSYSSSCSGMHWIMISGAFCFLFLFSESTLGQTTAADEEDSDPLSLIDYYIGLSSNYINRNLDSAIYFGEEAHALIEELDSDSAKAIVYTNLGSVYRANGNHAISLDYYLKSLSLLDEILAEYPSNMNIIFIKSDLLDLMGVNYFYQSKYDKALEYYDQSLALLEIVKQNEPDITDGYHKFKLLNNIAGVYIRKEDYDRAIEYYTTSIDLLGDDNKGLMASSLYNNIGICYMEKFEFESAFHYLQKALEIRQSEGDTRGIAQCYNNLGKNYFYQQNYREAERYADMALKLGRDIGNPESIRISLKALTDVYDSIGDVSRAYETFREYTKISDSIFNAENIARISQLEVRHEFEQQQRIFDVEIKRREAEEQKRKIIYLSIAGILFFSLLTAILLIFLQRSKIRHSKLEKELLELEHKHLSLEKEKLKEQLDFKNRELTTNVMYLLKKNELITSISEKLIRSKLEFKKENQKIIQEIINELKSGQDNDTWAEFEAYFTQVHTDFYKRLNKKFPYLSANERKLCAFLRLNMSTKDIAAITYQSVNSITVARSRLKKKLNIKDDEMSLVNYLAQF